MSTGKVYTAIGLMSGTSLDGEIDVALLETDGQDHVKALGFYVHRYDPDLREPIRAAFGLRDRSDPVVVDAESIVTDLHIEAVKGSGFEADVVGFHGQTIFHNSNEGVTVQLGNGRRLAAQTGMDAVCDFRSADVAAGGQGAPLLPLYHRALMADHEKPVAILNIGGVANVTYVGEDDLIAFDTGPGNALMDDFVKQRTGAAFDRDGDLASAGTPQENILYNSKTRERSDFGSSSREKEGWLQHPYFQRSPPKSLDRNEWDVAALGPMVEDLAGLSTEDGLATLLEFTARSILQAEAHFPAKPHSWYVCGGGAHNTALMQRLGMQSVVELGWNGDAIEAEGFAYLAVRSLLGLPLSMPSTTGVPKLQTGGVLYTCK